ALTNQQGIVPDHCPGTFELDSALESGMRGNELIPALLNDFNVWQTCPPDRWVKADLFILSSTYSPVSNGTTTVGPLGILPDEIIFEILLNIPIESILSFTSTCKFLRHHFGREVDKFYAACNDSNPSQAESAYSKPADVSAIFSANFPLLEFFRTNYRTDSMRNRRRLWKISQQFREEWYRYRVEENEQFRKWRNLDPNLRSPLSALLLQNSITQLNTMGCWDELCLICGLRPGGGPRLLCGELEKCLDMIIQSLEKQKIKIESYEDDDELIEDIKRILSLFEGGDFYIPTNYERAVEEGSISPGSYFPFTYERNNWDGWKAIAIGIFDQQSNGDGPPGKGKAVTTRLVTHWTEVGGRFGRVEGSDVAVYTDASASSDAFFCLRGPYFYVQSWIDRDSLPPRQATFPLEPDMSFEGEFYEIVHYRLKRMEYTGKLEEIDYEGIDLTLDQWQDTFCRVFTGANELGRALKCGRRGNDLIPALLRDFNVWQTCPADSSTGIRVARSVRGIGHWKTVPVEIVIEVLCNLSIQEVLSFGSSCRDCYWFLPVANVEGEVEKFLKACKESKYLRPNATRLKSSCNSTIFDPDFPTLDFFRANYSSDSMKNRRRLWRISQQFRQEWYKYRTEGYKRAICTSYEENTNGDETIVDEEDEGKIISKCRPTLAVQRISEMYTPSFRGHRGFFATCRERHFPFTGSRERLQQKAFVVLVLRHTREEA
ncbi:4255_t:CDS:10, partial [Acaulospora colombiana]